MVKRKIKKEIILNRVKVKIELDEEEAKKFPDRISSEIKIEDKKTGKSNIDRKCQNCKEEYPLEDMDYFTKGGGTILLCKLCSGKIK